MATAAGPPAWRALGDYLIWRAPAAVVDVDGDGVVEIFVAQPSPRAMREAVVLRKGADGKYVGTGRIVLRTTGPNPC